MENINKEPKVRPLTKKEIIKFCNVTIAEIKSYNKDRNNEDRDCGDYLCDCLYKYLVVLNNCDNKKEKSFYIPEFTNENAVKYCNGWVGKNRDYWWSGNLSPDGYDSKNRILFLEWIKSHYTTPKQPLIKKGLQNIILTFMNKFITYLFVGTFASVAFIIIILYLYLMGGLAIYKLYEWFIMPLSPNIPKITYLMCLGIIMFASLFSTPQKEFKKDIVDVNKSALITILKYPSALLFGYILHLIIN